MKLSIIIVSYNVCSYLRQCLHSIYQADNIKDIDVIVVDNYSHDKTCDMIADEYPKVRLIKNHVNLGFSKSVNIGQVHANGEYLCVLNPDTLVSENTFTTLLDYINNHPEVGCIGPKIMNPDGTLQLACRRSFPHPLTAFFKLIGLSRLFPKSPLFGRYNLTYLDENEIHKVDALSGSFMLIPRKIFQVVGEFDESFFMYGEDLDYCYRIQQCGYKLVYNPHVSIIHYKGESVKSAPFNTVSIFYSAINTFYRKHSDNFPSWKFISPFVSIGIYLHKMCAYLSNYFPLLVAWFLDTFIISVCFAISLFIWYPYYHKEIVTLNSVFIHWPLLLDLIISWSISSYWLHLYKKDYLSYGRSIITAALTILLSASSTYFIGFIAYSRVVLAITLVMTAFITATWRMLLHLMYRYRPFVRTPLFGRRAVILGTGDESMRIGTLLSNTPSFHFTLIGYIDNHNVSGTDQFIGRLEDIHGIVRNHHINEIVIPEKWASISKLILFIQDIKDLNIICKLVPESQKMLIGKGVVENLSGIPLMDIGFPLFDKLHQITKRIFDLILSSLLILLTFPIHLHYLLLGKKYDQTVWTVDGQHIHLYRYKSKIKVIEDLPLLFIILAGDMSFVGTQVIEIIKKDPRMIIKPGLTGLFHLKDSNIQPDTVRDFEKYYAMHYSLVFDIEIIFKSILQL